VVKPISVNELFKINVLILFKYLFSEKSDIHPDKHHELLQLGTFDVSTNGGCVTSIWQGAERGQLADWLVPNDGIYQLIIRTHKKEAMRK
jgi:hypothetical protein